MLFSAFCLKGACSSCPSLFFFWDFLLNGRLCSSATATARELVVNGSDDDLPNNGSDGGAAADLLALLPGCLTHATFPQYCFVDSNVANDAVANQSYICSGGVVTSDADESSIPAPSTTAAVAVFI